MVSVAGSAESPLLSRLGKRNFEEHERLVARNDFGVRDIEDGCVCERHVAGEVEEAVVEALAKVTARSLPES